MVIGLRIRILLCVMWLVAVIAGTGAMLTYQNAAGRVGQTPPHWPRGTKIPHDRNRPTLLMFAHSHCPCTRASISELNRLLARCPEGIATHVMFFKPGELAKDWTHTDLWRSATAIPNVTVHEDRDGELARRFGAETSGYVVLYGPQGQLLFSGGITAGRGHAGDNAGANMIISLLTGADTGSGQTPVYGCTLLNNSQISTTRTIVCTK
jgi:hypothetical protein